MIEADGKHHYAREVVKGSDNWKAAADLCSEMVGSLVGQAGISDPGSADCGDSQLAGLAADGWPIGVSLHLDELGG
ncbi:hypothetical protein ACWC0A_10830 [Streptomyces scopuliridis]